MGCNISNIHKVEIYNLRYGEGVFNIIEIDRAYNCVYNIYHRLKEF